jgi:hypothetical protein
MDEMTDTERQIMERVARERAALPPFCPGCGKKIETLNDWWAYRGCCKPCALIYCELDARNRKW